jgi:ribosomal-protein-alanine N-acetyltransferase
MDKKSYWIRPASMADIDALVALERASYTHPWTLEQFRPEFENQFASVLVSVIGEQIVGYLCFWLIAGEMQVLKLTTCLSARRQGIASQLLRAAFEQQDELRSVWLEVRESNSAAIALYCSLGFCCEGRRKAYYRDGEDALLMVRIS